MNRNELRFFYECTLGRKSHLNMLGKVVFFPVIIAMGLAFWLFDLIFGNEGDV